MIDKKKTIYELDNAEYRYHLINGTLSGFKPRLMQTPKTYNIINKKNDSNSREDFSKVNTEDLNKEIRILKTELLHQKVHYAESKLNNIILRQLENQHGLFKKFQNSKNAQTLKILEEINTKFGFDSFTKFVVRSKIIKIVVGKVCPTKALKENPPTWFNEDILWKQFLQKNDEFNPCKVWNDIVKSIKGADKITSQLFSAKKVKLLINRLENGVSLVLGKRKREYKEERNKGYDINSVCQVKSPNNNSKLDTLNKQVEQEEEKDKVDDDTLLAEYERIVVDSEVEKDKPEFRLNPSINHNEGIDEEQSTKNLGYNGIFSCEEEDRSRNKQKTQVEFSNLPQLMTGYYSGSEQELDDDEVASEQIELNSKRRNRRGQRARQKIWEKKYGRNAKHIQLQLKKEHQDAEKRRVEYEERVARRAAKASSQRDIIAIGSNTFLNSTENIKYNNTNNVQVLHPSWTAKKHAKENQKNVKFQGKKIVFD